MHQVWQTTEFQHTAELDKYLLTKVNKKKVTEYYKSLLAANERNLNYIYLVAYIHSFDSMNMNWASDLKLNAG